MKIGEKIKELLEKKGITAYTLSNETGVSQGTLSRIINKNTKPNASNLKAISDYFEVSQTWLLTGKEYSESDTDLNKKNVSEIKEVDFDEFMEAEYLPIKVQAGYLSGLEENKPIELKKMLVPKEFEKGFYKVIEIEGDSMNDGTPRSICDGDKLLLKQIEGGNYLHKTLPYRNNLFVIASSEGIVCKQIIAQDIERECIVCHSFNPLHKDYEICFRDIYQLFYVKKLVERKIKF